MRVSLFLLLHIPFAIVSTYGQVQIGRAIDGEAKGDYSGSSISLSSDGRRVAIGAPFNDGNGDNSGHVRIYQELNRSWIQVGDDIDGEAKFDKSGQSVSLSSDGRRIAIGAPGSSGNGVNSGHVRIYEERGGTWRQVGEDIDGEAEFDESGQSVSLSSDGGRIAIGSNSGNGNNSGQVRIYEELDGTWRQVGSDIDGEAPGDLLGSSVSLSIDGTRLAIGAPANDGNGELAGHVQIYEEQDGTWRQVGEDIDGEAAGDKSGQSVSLSSDGRRVAIGAPWNNGSGEIAGQVRIYEERDGTWRQVGADIDGEAAGDKSGQSISLSSDGRRVAIGAPANDGNGNFSGHTRIYEERDGTWIRAEKDIDGEAENDQSGFVVALSSDGRRLAIGAPWNDGTGNSSGHVRIYGDFLSNVPEAALQDSEESIEIFPNPSKRLINIVIETSSYQGIIVRVTDNLGRTVWGQKVVVEGKSPWRKELMIDRNGAYVVTAQIGEKIIYDRILILGGE